jgi:long-chain acyl-CoA synthetase
MSTRPYLWEKSYPPGVDWGAPITQTTLPAFLDGIVADWATHTAIDYRDQEFSYSDLGRMVAQTASGMLRRGIGAGDTVALYLPNTPYHPIGFFAALKTGARLAHLSPLDAERELIHKLTDSGARIVLTTNIGGMLPMALKLMQAGHLDRIIVGEEEAFGPPTVPVAPVPQGEERVVTIAALIAEGRELPAQWPLLAVDDVALLQYTGGTTGVPKAAMLTHGNLTGAVSMYETWVRGQKLFNRGEERVICILPLFHIFGLTSVMLLHLKSGNALFLRIRFDVEAVLRDIEVKRASIFPGVPTMWIALASVPGVEKRDFSSLRYCGSGGAPLPVEVAQRFEKLTGLRLGGGWGMTETSPAGTVHPRSVPKPAAIGLPLPGIVMEIVALDDPRRVLPTGETGEIRIKGANVTQGYWRRPEETKAAFVDGFLLTGDIGYIDEDGYFFLVDRKKDLIISGGFNVYPTMVENAIYEHPQVAEVIVIGVKDPYRGEAAKAFVKLREGAPGFTLEELNAFLADKLGRHEMPSSLEFRTTLPRTAVGKLSRKELAAEELAKATSS